MNISPDALAATDSAAVAAIPRDYNFARDICDRISANEWQDKTAYIDPRGTWSYGQFATRVEQFARALDAFTRPEERVLIALLDPIDWPTAFLGTLYAGRVAVPVNTLFTEDDYAYVLADSRATALVVSAELYPKFARLIASPAFSHVRRVIVSG